MTNTRERSMTRVIYASLWLSAALLSHGATVMAQPVAGIKVHGQWTIDVRAQDGSLVLHREFKNALTQDGAYLLMEVLGGGYTHGEWLLRLDGVPDSVAPCSEANTPHSCMIAEPTYLDYTNAVVPTRDSRNLTVQRPGDRIVMSGSITASRAGSVGAVRSFQTLCYAGVPALSCKGNDPSGSIMGLGAFTAATLPQPINVVAGQIIQVTFVVTFS